MKILILTLITMLSFGCNDNKSNSPFNIICYSGGVEVKRIVVDEVINTGNNGFVAFLKDKYIGTYSHNTCFLFKLENKQ